jgi:hypothetical protein
MKRFKILYNIGKSKYAVSFHDGASKHRDGSDFFDLRIFKNKRSMFQFVAELCGNGYAEEVFHI